MVDIGGPNGEKCNWKGVKIRIVGVSTPRHVQGNSDAKNRHLTYQISNPARDFEQCERKRAQESTGIEPGPPEWQTAALSIALTQQVTIFTEKM